MPQGFPPGNPGYAGYPPQGMPGNAPQFGQGNAPQFGQGNAPRYVLGGGPGPEFQQPGAPTQPGANYNAPPAMVIANMATHLPASNPTRVPLGGGMPNRPAAPLAQRNDLGMAQNQPLQNQNFNAGPIPAAKGPASPRSPIQMPGPEAFGLGHNKEELTEVNWTVIRKQMRDLGVKSFQNEEIAGGKFRLTCQLQTSTGSVLLVEGLGNTEKEAVDNCLAKAQQARNAR